MIRPIVSALALAAALAIPAGSQAADSQLINLSLAHMNSTKKIANCTGVLGCSNAIAGNMRIVTTLTARATARLEASNNPACMVAARSYLREGTKLIASAHRFVDVGGSTATRDAYYYQAVRFDATLNPLVKAC